MDRDTDSKMADLINLGDEIKAVVEEWETAHRDDVIDEVADRTGMDRDAIEVAFDQHVRHGVIYLPDGSSEVKVA